MVMHLVFCVLQDVELIEIGDGTSDQAVERQNEDDGADDAVDEPHRADVEVSAHLIDKESNHTPPQQSAHDDEGITDNHVVELVFRQGETETRKQGDNKEHNERIAQGEQEPRHHIPQVVITLVDILLDLAHRVMENHVNCIDNEDDTTDNLQDVDVVGDEIGHERNAQAHQQTIEQIAGGSPHPGEEPRIASLVQGALNA